MRVLLVDDDTAFVERVQRVLTAKGVNCRETPTIAEGLEAAGQERFDLIVCSYFMPGCDGLTALEQIGSIHPGGRLVITSDYSLNFEFRRDDRLVFIPKQVLLEWLEARHAQYQKA